MSKDTLVRLCSAAIGLVLFFIVIFADRLVFGIALSVLALFMLFEFFRALKFGIIMNIIGIAGAAALFCISVLKADGLVVPVLILYTAVLAAASVFYHSKIGFKDISAAMFAAVYIGLFTSFIFRVYDFDNNGLCHLFLIFICAWITDTGAYFAGRLFGRHKLAPKISPKKTVEGAVGGVICSIAGCIVLGYVMTLTDSTTVQPNYIMLSAIGLVGSCLAQLGDLLCSLVKRECEIKDFGNIMPGHGGVLDRFDSVIMVAPFVYCMLSLL